MNSYIVVNSIRYAYPDPMSALEQSGNRVSSSAGHLVFTDLSFSIDRGLCVGLVGPNGAGKTTLLWLLAGLLEADAGYIQIDSLVMNKQNRRVIQRKLGLAFQNPDDMLFMTTVRQDVEFGPRHAGLSDSEVHQRAMNAMKQAGCLHLANRPPHRLSGGEKRSVSLAAILAMEPEILLLDEPSAALDPRSRRELIQLLSRLPQTKLIATHDLDMVLDLCDLVFILKEGAITASGIPQAILTDRELLHREGLELPLSVSRTSFTAIS
ncbi:MAG: ABC transporter ATP-binding protein [Termitinemataceae bacterium]